MTLASSWKKLYEIVALRYADHLEKRHNGLPQDRGECKLCDDFNDVLAVGKERKWKG